MPSLMGRTRSELDGPMVFKSTKKHIGLRSEKIMKRQRESWPFGTGDNVVWEPIPPCVRNKGLKKKNRTEEKRTERNKKRTKIPESTRARFSISFPRKLLLVQETAVMVSSKMKFGIVTAIAS